MFPPSADDDNDDHDDGKDDHGKDDYEKIKKQDDKPLPLSRVPERASFYME